MRLLTVLIDKIKGRKSCQTVYQEALDRVWEPKTAEAICGMSNWFLKDFCNSEDYSRLSTNDRNMLLHCVQLQCFKAQALSINEMFTGLKKILE